MTGRDGDDLVFGRSKTIPFQPVSVGARLRAPRGAAHLRLLDDRRRTGRKGGRRVHTVDYSTFEKAEAAGFPPDALIDDDRSRCQAEGRRLRSEGRAGVISPSAALPGSMNITLFGRRVGVKWGVPTKLASAIPCCVVALGGPPPGLAERVRHPGDAHAGYEDYLANVAEREREERFAEPDTPKLPVRRPEPENPEKSS